MSTNKILTDVTIALSKLFEGTFAIEDEDLVDDEAWVHTAIDAAMIRSADDGWELLESA